MAKPLRVEAPAERELEDAAHRIEDRSGLERAKAFMRSVRATFARIAESPETFRPLRTTRRGLVVRAVSVPRSRYHVVYFESSEAVHVFALAHSRRRPLYWRHRLPPPT